MITAKLVERLEVYIPVDNATEDTSPAFTTVSNPTPSPVIVAFLLGLLTFPAIAQTSVTRGSYSAHVLTPRCAETKAVNSYKPSWLYQVP